MSPVEISRFVSPASFWTPKFIPASAWLEHAPFAFWLCDTLRPKRFVELGSHFGYSYFAFCQGLQQLGLKTTAYAVDTWQGDEHAGFYDDAVYNGVRDHNRTQFSGFSTLMRTTFAQAAEYFEDGSIDLLHIDGRHYYEDVREDYLTWLPKLSPDAVVLFHDTNVRERNFGVWKFFQELAREHPSFEFVHCNGLGVIAPGASPPAALQPLLSASPDDIALVRKLYASLGESITVRRALLAKTTALRALLDHGEALSLEHAEGLGQTSDGDYQIQEVLGRVLRAAAGSVEARQQFEARSTQQAAEAAERAAQQQAEVAQQAAHRAAEAAERTAEMERLAAELRRVEALRHDAEASLLESRAALAELQATMTAAEREMRRQSLQSQRVLQHQLRDRTAELVTEQKRHAAELAEAQARRHSEHSEFLAEQEHFRRHVAHLEQEVVVQRAVAERLTQELEQVYHSSSWKMLAPLQQTLTRHPAIRTLGRRSAKLLWWTATGQIASRLRRRRMGAVAPLPGMDVAPAQAPASPDTADSTLMMMEAGIHEVARPIDRDHSLSLPLSFASPDEVAPGGAVAAVIHMFYPELAVEFRSYLQNIPGRVDLFLSACDGMAESQIRNAFAGWEKGSVDVRLVANRGRDIAPKLVTFRDVYDRYELVLHLHSKKSNHASVLYSWRQHLLQNLIGNSDVVASVFHAFRLNPRLGMVAAAHFEPVRHWINWGSNLDFARQLADRMDLRLDGDAVLDFPSGSMFWARSAALRPLLDLNLATEDFPAEEAQIDGTVAHAIERLYFFVCEKAGFDWIKVAQPDLFDLTPAIITARNDAQLQQFFSRYVFRLLEPGEAKPRAIAPTPLAAPSPRLLEHVRGQILGRSGDVPALRVVLGFVTYNNDAGDLRLAVEAAEQALRQASLAGGTAIFLVDNGEPSDPTLPDGLLRRFDSQGNVGFGAAHNRLMLEAFSGGADLYVAVNPDGLLHPNAVAELVRMSHANGGAALVEALQFPMEHPKPFEPDTFDTPWVSGACLAIPRRIHDAIGGFDDAFFMYCEDVDLSWRARAAGFALKTCPTALFLHAVTNRGTNRNTVRMIYESGVILARKWGAPNFEDWLRTEFDAMGLQMPRSTPITVPPEWRPYAEFGHHFSFAKARW